jgi:uncharacterized membrane protein (UPF0127 family)
MTDNTAIKGSQPFIIQSMMQRLLSKFRTRRQNIAFGILGLTFMGSALAQDAPQMNLQRITLSAGMHQISAQVAATPQQRQTGLMFRKEMPQPEGMLFIFDEPSQQCFWMKNTLLPLTAAFIADDGTIVNLADMRPQTTDTHCSGQPVRYVLEMNQGWFAKKGIKAGSRLSGPPFDTKR